MIIILFLISIGLFAFIMWQGDEEYLWIPVIGIIVKTIALAIIAWNLVECRVIDEKVTLYEVQNKEIEQKIEIAVKGYMQHENNTFKELKTNDSYITLVTLYPELKADTLIQQEINIYEDNNNKVIKLKEQKINKSIYKWWLYFGK